MRKFLNFFSVSLGILMTIGLLFFTIQLVTQTSVYQADEQIAEATSMPTKAPTITLTGTDKTTTITSGDFSLTVTEPQPANIPCFAPQFAPDGNRYLCRRGQPAREMWLGTLDKGITELLVKEVADYAWTPNGKEVVYTEWVDSKEKPLKMLDLDTGSVSELGTSDLPYSMMQFTPAQELIYAQHGELRAAKLASDTGRTVISQDQTITEIPPFNDDPLYQISFEFSPDGERIAIAEGTYSNNTLAIVDRNTGKTIEISNEIGASLDAFSWSPDGRKLAYSIISKDDNQAELWLVDADGSNPNLLTETNEQMSYNFLNWLPNGKVILFVLIPTGGTNAIQESIFQVIDSKGGEPQTLFTDGSYLQLIGNGNRLVFYREYYDENSGRVSKSGYWIASLTFN
ncbi:MAG: hypothetical protein Fur0044_32490 [Anaerolineae bacterium]|nr:PD40 domain-containing protein [Anaerolineales bacterium]MCQ3976421.1 hypothetical protein [Anaerolineae bacterium]